MATTSESDIPALPASLGGFRPDRLAYELRRRGCWWPDLMKEPASLGSSTVTSLRRGYLTARTAQVLTDFLRLKPVVPELDALLVPPVREEAAS